MSGLSGSQRFGSSLVAGGHGTSVAAALGVVAAGEVAANSEFILLVTHTDLFDTVYDQGDAGLLEKIGSAAWFENSPGPLSGLWVAGDTTVALAGEGNDGGGALYRFDMPVAGVGQQDASLEIAGAPGDTLGAVAVVADYLVVGADHSGGDRENAVVYALLAADLDGAGNVSERSSYRIRPAPGVRLLGMLLRSADASGDGVDDLLMPGLVDADGVESVGWVRSDRLSIAQTTDDLDGFVVHRDAGLSLWSTATGDLNDDGVIDLVVASHTETVDAGERRGRAYVFFGPLRPGVVGVDEADATVVGSLESRFFGQAMVVADLSGDGVADLVIGAPGDPSSIAPGAVYVLDGPLKPWAYELPDARYASESCGGRFGSALAAGDFDGDGAEDLAVGEPFRSTSDGIVGAVHVF